MFQKIVNVSEPGKRGRSTVSGAMEKDMSARLYVTWAGRTKGGEGRMESNTVGSDGWVIGEAAH